MLEPPDLTTAHLIKRARSRFTIPVNDAEFLPVGNDSSAWAFRLSAGHDAWFLKILARPVDAASLEVPRYLTEQGLEHLLAPIPTITGGSFDPGKQFNFIVYPFVYGEPGGEIGLTAAQQTGLGRVARRIHDMPISDELATTMRRERFVPPAVELARRIGKEVGSAPFDDRFQRSFAAFWLRHQGEIDRIIERTETLGAEAHTLSGDLVSVTPTSMPGTC